LPRQRKTRPLPPKEIIFETTVPISIVVEHVGAHWRIRRVVVNDECIDLDNVVTALGPTGIRLDNADPVVRTAFNAVREEDWPAWDFGW
jgi:hypothetical protein